MKFKSKQLLTIIWFLLLSATAIAQNPPGKRDSIYSNILKEQVMISIVVPQDYKAGSGQKYDVLYVLDGDYNIGIMSVIQHYLEQEIEMPPTIIAGILDRHRERDFTPTHTDVDPTTSGADNYLRFFKEELMPYIEKDYPTNGDNTLFGHSYAGLFTTYVLFKDPLVIPLEWQYSTK